MGTNRAERRRADRAGEPTDSGSVAYIEDNFRPGFYNVAGDEAQPGQRAQVRLQMYAAPIGKQGPLDLYVFCKQAAMDPDVAIQIGEILVKEGQRVKSKVEIAAAGAVPNLRG